MRRLFTALLLVLFVAQAQAGCRANDKWRGNDKQLHALAGGGIAYIATLQTGSPMEGFLWGAGAGLLKEAIDATGQGDCSAQDLLVSVAAAGVGAGLGRLSLSYIPSRSEVRVTYAIPLR